MAQGGDGCQKRLQRKGRVEMSLEYETIWSSSKSGPYELKGSPANNSSGEAGTNPGCPEPTRVHSSLRGCRNPTVPAEINTAYFRVTCCLGLRLRTSNRGKRWDV